MKLAKRPTNPLERLQEALIALKTFEHRHEIVFDQYRELKEEIEIAETEVKTWCKQNQKSLSTDKLYAEFTEAKSRWYDVDTTRAILKQLNIDPATTAAIFLQEWSVDEKKLKQLAAFKDFKMEETFKAAYREKTVSNRVSIAEKKEENHS
jgi:hypothetical protein